ncbi:hypothetical protein [Streptomyces sp. DHE17-7]|uniref:hypothetical protein n=1 Tax=Streptomyces sp. DHE17-7 TaxID=2759949 RepID=UPI000EEE449C|nr:hypothetical protein [Streptomyces sp. DHE17-7]MBJ6623508.1 hypothetical protein [Streptomyces sp. DHE17-7]RIH58743.1 hypothetical protein D3C59_32900 [Streptomyces sp. SHP22-7]
MDDAARKAIAHLAEALYLLSSVRDQGDTTDVPIHIGPATAGHTIHVTARTAEALSDAVDSMNAYLASEGVEDDKLGAAARQAQPAIDAFLGNDDASVARRLEELHARVEAGNDETIPSGEWSAAAVAQNDPDLYADVTDLFDSIDPISLLDDVLNSDQPEEAAAAYEQMTGEWDGEL